MRDYLRLPLAARDRTRCSSALFLDSQNRLLAAEELFRGTLAQTSVYPREVVKAALAHNAAAVIFAHNHPSGVAEPSRADELLTQALKQALALVDIRRSTISSSAGGAAHVVRRARAALSGPATPCDCEACESECANPDFPRYNPRLSHATSNAKERAMARVCQVTGKAPMVGNNVSHANNKTKRRFLPNLQRRRFWVESENRWVSLRLTNAALRTIDKNGIDVVLADLRARGEHV